ncbi:MAG: hypothetical protein NC347_07545 [Clostridium sp.]|nr:hypothetical protein [Clostridium sp.]
MDVSFYNQAIADFKNAFQEFFPNTVILKEEHHNFEFMGSFLLVYVYIPLGYRIFVENEGEHFTIILEDGDKAHANLYHIKKFEHQLCEENITGSLKVLKDVLLENAVDFYLWKGNKLYRKNAQGIKRIKDINGHLKGCR